MNDCLVTRLKGSSNNPNLEVLNEIRLSVASGMGSGDFIRVPVKSKVVALSGAFKISENGSLLTEYTFPDSVSSGNAKIYFDDNACVISVISDYNNKWNCALNSNKVTILSDTEKIFVYNLESFNMEGNSAVYSLDVTNLDFSGIRYTFKATGNDWVIGDIANIGTAFGDASSPTVWLNNILTGTIEDFASKFIEKHPGVAKSIEFHVSTNSKVTYQGELISNGTLTIASDGTYSYA